MTARYELSTRIDRDFFDALDATPHERAQIVIDAFLSATDEPSPTRLKIMLGVMSETLREFDDPDLLAQWIKVAEDAK